MGAHLRNTKTLFSSFTFHSKQGTSTNHWGPFSMMQPCSHFLIKHQRSIRKEWEQLLFNFNILKKKSCCCNKDMQNQVPSISGAVHSSHVTVKRSVSGCSFHILLYSFEYFCFADRIEEFLLTSLRSRTENRHGIFSIRNWCRMTRCGDFLGTNSIFWLYKNTDINLSYVRTTAFLYWAKLRALDSMFWEAVYLHIRKKHEVTLCMIYKGFHKWRLTLIASIYN